MNKTKNKTIQVTAANQRAALSSPLRLEILGLFTNGEPLAIADMALLMSRSAGSLYHHVGILEKASLLQRTGTRPKGKRHEALFLPKATRIEVATPTGDDSAINHAVKTMGSAFRMVERDLEAVLQEGNGVTQGPDRNLFATRMHVRTSPKLLAKINKHLQAVVDLLTEEATKPQKPTANDQHLSITIALLPIKGRGKTSKGS